MRPQRRGSTLRRLLLLLLSASLATVALVVIAAPADAVTTTVAVNGGSAGRTFDGVGAISGSGGNSRCRAAPPAAVLLVKQAPPRFKPEGLSRPVPWGRQRHEPRRPPPAGSGSLAATRVSD